jgi:hypothetical protein
MRRTQYNLEINSIRSLENTIRLKFYALIDLKQQQRGKGAAAGVEFTLLGLPVPARGYRKSSATAACRAAATRAMRRAAFTGR